jgi:hypothetical protein
MSRNYSNFAKTGSLAAPVAAGDASILVDTQTDYPAPSYVIVVYEGASTPQAAPNKETMLVTGVTDNGDGTFTLTVDRDIDGYNGGGISFSDAATVEHTVVADEVGPKKTLVQSQVLKSNRMILYDDFDRPDRTLDGDSAPTGQTWSANGTSSNIVDGAARGGDMIIPCVSNDNTNDPYQVEAWIYRNSGVNNYIRIYGYWSDSNNWIAVEQGNGSTGLLFKYQGSVSNLGSTPDGFTERNGIVRIGMQWTPSRPSIGFWKYPIGGESNFDTDTTTGIETVISNSTHVGFLEGGGHIESIRVYDPVA